MQDTGDPGRYPRIRGQDARWSELGAGKIASSIDAPRSCHCRGPATTAGGSDVAKTRGKSARSTTVEGITLSCDEFALLYQYLDREHTITWDPEEVGLTTKLGKKLWDRCGRSPQSRLPYDVESAQAAWSSTGRWPTTGQTRRREAQRARREARRREDQARLQTLRQISVLMSPQPKLLSLKRACELLRGGDAPALVSRSG
jgi:hypothetical protein